MSDLKPFDGKLDSTELKPFSGVLDGEKSGALRKLADYPLAVAGGAVGAVKSIADAAGAGNAVSGVLNSANEGINNLLSPEAKAEDQQISTLMGDAQSKGMNWEGVKAGVKAFGVAPVRTSLSGLGSVAPIIAGTALTGGGLPAAAVAGGIGVAMGAGTAKGAIYDDIKKRSLAGGMNEADATAAATKAQEYGGVNTDQIALGGALGAADSLTGVSKAASSMLGNAIRKPVLKTAITAPQHGIVRRAGMGMLGEMPLEAAQGGQEQLAANIAAQRAGFDAGTWDNVASKATLEALASAGPGAAFGVMHTSKAPTPTPPPEPTGEIPAPAGLGYNPAAGTHTVFPDGSVILNSDQPAGEQAVFDKRYAAQPIKPSEAMGINPAAGVLSKAAAMAVDTGAHAQTLQAAAEQIQQETATNKIADQTINTPATTEKAPENAPAFGSAYAQRQATAPKIEPTDILSTDGQPFVTGFSAKRTAEAAGDGFRPFKIAEKQFVVRNFATENIADQTINTPATAKIEAQNAPEAKTQAVETGTNEGAAGAQPAATDTPARTSAVETARVSPQSIRDTLTREIETGMADVTGVKLSGIAIQQRKYKLKQLNEKESNVTEAAQTVQAAQKGQAPTPPKSINVVPYENKPTAIDGASTRPAIDSGSTVPAGLVLPERSGSDLPARPTAVSQDAEKADLAGKKINKEWTAFTPESGTLNVPRAEMPQIKAEHRGAMVNFLKARGIDSTTEDVAAESLKPTQTEFSTAKVNKAKAYEGGDRSILVSSDGHVLDGHHQWLAKREKGEPVKVIKLNAPIKDLLATVKEFPSAGQSSATQNIATEANNTPAIGGIETGKPVPAGLAKMRAGKTAKAIERIAKGTAYFSTTAKAKEFIESNGLKDTHEFVKHASGANRWDIVAKAAAPIDSQKPTLDSVSIADAAIKDVASDDGIIVKQGKGFIKDKFLAEVDGDGVPGGPFDTENAAREAAEAWRSKKADRATENASERARRDAMAERIKAGAEPTANEIKSLDLAANESDIRWFFPTAANLFGLTSRQIRPMVADMIRVGLTDMGTKRELVPTKKALMAIGQSLTATKTVAKIEDSGAVLDAESSLWSRITDGTATIDEFKAGFERWVSGKDAILEALSKNKKDDLLKMGGSMFAYRNKSENKATIVESLWRDGATNYVIGRSFQHGMGKNAWLDGIRSMVENTDADQLAQYAASQKAAQEEAVAKVGKIAEAIKDPKTLDDYKTWMRATMNGGKTFKEARMILEPAQRATFDELVATETRGSRKASKDEQRSSVSVAGQNTDGNIIATKHTKKGHNVFVVQLADRVSKEDYNTLNAGAKRIGGYYSSFRGAGATPGFQFTERAQAEAFVKLANGDNTDAQAAAQDRRNAFEDDRSQTAVERLTEMADRLDERADASLNQGRKENTDKRARQAASAQAAANADKATAKTMRNIAGSVADGSAKFLDRLRQKVQVEALQGYIATAQYDELRAKYPDYSAQERHRGEAPTIETADFAEFPTFSAYRSDLATLARQLVTVDGTKLMGQKLLKVADDVSDAFNAFAKENTAKLMAFRKKDGSLAVFSSREAAERSIEGSGFKGKAIVYMVKRGEYALILSPSEAIERGVWQGDGDQRIALSPEFGAEMVEKIGKAARRGAKVSVPWQLESAHDRRKLLSRMGIETPAEFRAALREFIGLQEQAAAPDKVKQLERAMVGRRNDGMDFFPTPESVADEMVATADIQPGMSVLEPSAGWGHIAERIRAAGVDPDVGEMSNDRRELLEAKGFRVVGRDFMEMNPRDFFTFGDTFKAQDGTVGVMRGLGGLGSNRVRLEESDGSTSYHDRDELTGTQKNGTESGYDRILMNPPFSDGRDIQHVQHAYTLLKPGGRIVAIMGESAFTNQNKRATEFREWLDKIGGTEEKLAEGSFNDPNLPVNTSANARMVVIEKSAKETDKGVAMFSRATQSGNWYSELGRQVLANKSNTMPAGMWAGWIESLKTKGVKPDEIEWSGVQDWLKLQTGKVTKADVSNYLNQNGVRVQETVLGDEQHYRDSSGNRVFDEETGDFVGSKSPTKYSQYQLPGGKNYREVLLTLPYKQNTQTYESWLDNRKFLGGYSEQELSKSAYEKDVGFYKERGVGATESVYKSSHWEQPNVLAHIRVNDRVDADGKRMLFVEEIQSDWGQDGKKKGFAGAPTDASVKIEKDGKEFTVTRNGVALFSTINEIRANEVLARELAKKDSGVPTAPFVTATDKWLSLALKRVIKMAVDGGYDKVAFVNGGQSADRYDLSKTISQVQYDPERKLLKARDLKDNKVLEETVEPDKIEDYIGKDAAKNLLASPINGRYHEVNGDGLKVGGEGMKAFYDKIVPNTTKEVIRKLGGAGFERVIIDNGTAYSPDVGEVRDQFEQPGFTITEAMREKAAGGVALFSRDNNATGLPTTQVKSITDTIKARWSAAPEIVIAANMDDAAIPQAVRDHNNGQLSQGAQGQPEGFFYAGKVYLIADQLATPKDVMRVLFHETLGHVGLRGAFGESLTSILKQIAVMRQPEVAAKAAQYGFDMTVESERLQAAEEVLAVMAQTKPEMGFVKRAIAAIRTWLRAHGVNLQLSDGDIVANYILPARAFVEGGKGAADGETAFARGINDTVTNQKDVVGNQGGRSADDTTPGVLKDKSGKALVVYHGTTQSFDKFEAKYISSGVYGEGFYFTSLKDDAELYSQGGRVIEANLSIKNPASREIAEEVANRIGEDDFTGIRKELQRMGYDGVIANSEYAGEVIYVAFNPEQVKLNESTTPNQDGVLYSRATAASLTKSATDKLNENFSAPGKLSWWHKSFGTMNNLAERSPAFKPVFDAAQGFINDTSYYATEAADMAGKILPKLESWSDLGKSPISATDNKAISAPIFEGTLSWARDESGKPVKLDELETRYKDLSTEEKGKMLLKKRIVTEDQLKRWLASSLDIYEGAVNNRFESTFLKAGVLWTDAELKSIFNQTPEQISLYKEFRAATDKSLDNMAKAEMLRFGGKDVAGLKDAVMDAKDADEAGLLLRDYLLGLAETERKEELTDTANGMIERADKVNKLKAEGYAPLSRFGKYSVDVVVDGERQYFGLHETMRDANIMSMKMKAEYGAANVSQGTLSESQFKLFAGITPESLELFGNMLGLDSTGNEAQDKAFQNYLKLTKTNRSAMRRMIHRKGIAGFSEDVGRVLASFVYSNARNTSAALNIGNLGEAINNIPKEQGELKDAAISLADYIKNPQEEAQAVRGLLFAQYLGGSVASAFVNLTQPFAVTFPWLSQYGGAKQSGAQLMRAMKDMSGKNTVYEADLAKALHHAEEMGIVSPQEVHQLMAQASGAGTLRSGDGTKLGDAAAKASNALSKLSLGWGKVFGMAEQLNRRSTFIAAYRIAKLQNMVNPAVFAEKAVNETQFVYSKANKMKFGRGAVGGTLMTFKTYSIAYLELLHRMYTQGGPEGKKAVLLALGVMMLMSGSGGLPFEDDILDLVDGLLQKLGYNISSKKAKQQFFEDLFGKAGADFVERGISGLPGMPLDVSGRMGMGNLIPGTGLLMQKNDHTSDVAELFGPMGDMVKRGFNSAGKALTGDVGGAALGVAPTAIRNMQKGAEMASTGQYKDAKGYKVIETTPLEAALKVIGFQPATVAKVQDSVHLTQQAKDFYNLQAADIRARWAKGISEKDPEQVKSARDDLKAWNEKNPEQKMVANLPAIWKKVHEMNKTKEQRVIDTAPKGMRMQLKRELAAQ